LEWQQYDELPLLEISHLDNPTPLIEHYTTDHPHYHPMCSPVDFVPSFSNPTVILEVQGMLN